MTKAREATPRPLHFGPLGPFLLAALAFTAGCGAAETRDPEPPSAEKPQGPEAPADEAPAPADGQDPRESLSPPGAQPPAGVLAQLRGPADRSERELAEHYYRAGKRFFDQMDHQRAYDNLKRAVMLDPSHVDATRLYYEAGEILGIRQEELKANLERLRQEQSVKVQLLRQHMLRFYESGEKAFNEKDYEQAIRDLERVIEVVAYSSYEIDPGQGESSYKVRAERLIAEAKRKRLEAELEQRNDLERKMIEVAKEEEARRKDREDDRIESMLQQTSDLLLAKRYVEAEELALEILDLQPHNELARRLREYAQSGKHLKIQGKRFEDWTEEEWATWHEVELAAVPKEGTYIDFPKNWKERTADRRPGIGNVRNEEAFWVRNYKQILASQKVTLTFNDTALRDVIQFLQDISGLNFVIGPDIDAESTTITLRLTKIKLENALRIILDQAGLTYLFDKEAIIIAEPGTKTGNTTFEIYEISDLLFPIKDFTAPRMSLPDPDNVQGGGGPGGGGGGLIFGDDDGGSEEPITGDALAEIIMSATGGDDVWGDEMTIEPHKGQLLVTATREVHERVLEVLENLRQNQGWFVHIETRFIEMTNDMLEDFGVDFRGLGGNPGDEQAVRGTANPNTTFPLGTPVDMEPVQGRNLGGTDVGVLHKEDGLGGGTQRNVGPGNDNFVWRTQHVFGNGFGAALGQRLQGGNGLNLQVTKLDPFQINAIIHAEYQSEKVHQLTAPRVTAANREKVFVSVVTQRAYISDWDLISGGTGLTVIEVPDPVIETLQEGVVLEVRPTISSDRKYVTLDMRPSLAQLVGGQINTVTVNLGSITMAAIAVPIGVPEITLQEAFTSVTIPDGGTALLGGFRQLRETREESSLPFIDNVPLLNVFFRRKAEVREMSSLVILVTARIISIRDEERKRFNRE